MTSVAAGGTTALGGLVARARAHADALALAVLLAVGGVVYYVAGRGLSFFFDEWDFVLGRRANDAGAFLDPHNGHLSVVPVLIYKALWATVGLRHYGPYRVVEVALHLVCVSLLYLLVRRRVGAPVALVAAASLLFLGRAWEDLVWPFQIGYLGSIAAGLGALLALEYGGRRGDVAAAVLLGLSLACSGLGIAFLVGGAVALLLERRSWSRLWVVAAPAVPYAVWYLHYGQNEASASNAGAVPGYVYDSLAGALGALSGLGTGPGKVLAALALVAVVVAVALRRPLAPALPAAAAVLAFWTLTALSRAQLHEPAASRYLYPGAALLLLVGAGLASGLRLPPVVVAALALLVATASLLNLHTLRDGAAGLRATDGTVDAELAAVELARTSVAHDFRPDTVRAPQVTAGPYLAAVRDLGSPALPASRLPDQSPAVRETVDAVLVRALAPVLVRRGTAPDALAAPAVDGFGSGALARRGGCVAFRPHGGAAPPSFDLVVPRHGLSLRLSGRVSLFLRRFADTYPATTTLRPGAGRWLLRPPADASTASWHVRIAGSDPSLACAVR